SMTRGSRLARAVYSAAVYPAGPEPMMITFSIGALQSIVHSGGHGLLLAAPPGDGLAEVPVGDRARDRGQPEREDPVGQHRDDREAAVDVEGDERADHAALDRADTARQR